MSDEIEFKVSLGGNLPQEQANGWNDQRLLEMLYRDRARIRYAVVAYNVNSYAEKTEDGTRRLTLQVKRVESTLPDDVDEETLEALLVQLFEKRTGQASLFGGENDSDGPGPIGFDDDGN